MRGHTPTQFLKRTPLNDATQDCIQIALADEHPVEAIYKFVQALVRERNWSEAEAQEVGSRAIGVVNALKLPLRGNPG